MELSDGGQKKEEDEEISISIPIKAGNVDDVEKIGKPKPQEMEREEKPEETKELKDIDKQYIDDYANQIGQAKTPEDLEAIEAKIKAYDEVNPGSNIAQNEKIAKTKEALNNFVNDFKNAKTREDANNIASSVKKFDEENGTSFIHNKMIMKTAEEFVMGYNHAQDQAEQRDVKEETNKEKNIESTKIESKEAEEKAPEEIKTEEHGEGKEKEESTKKKEAEAQPNGDDKKEPQFKETGEAEKNEGKGGERKTKDGKLTELFAGQIESAKTFGDLNTMKKWAVNRKLDNDPAIVEAFANKQDELEIIWDIFQRLHGVENLFVHVPQQPSRLV